MFLKNSEYDRLERVRNILPQGIEYDALSKDEQDIITDFDCLLMELYKRKKECNRKTAEYIAKRRKTNKNYAR